MNNFAMVEADVDALSSKNAATFAIIWHHL